MPKGKPLVGLDIGSSSVKLCHLKEAKKGYLLKAFDIVQFPQEAIVDGVIMNQGVVIDAIRSLVTRNRIRQKECAIAVSGYSVIVKRITLPLMTDQELESNLQWEVEQKYPLRAVGCLHRQAGLGPQPTAGDDGCFVGGRQA